MILANLHTDDHENGWAVMFEGGRFVRVRYVDGPRAEQIRTETEIAEAARLALLRDPESTDLVVR